MKQTGLNVLKSAICLVLILINLFTSIKVNAETKAIDRFEVDFAYQGVHYQILSKDDCTVAVAQPYDIDSNGMLARPFVPSRSVIGENGFLMSYGLSGSIVEIPQTVYDESGIAYTVTALAGGRSIMLELERSCFLQL